MVIMAESSEHKKCQQNLLNYVSCNLNTKVEKEKEKEITKEKGKTKSDGKSSSDSISATSGPKQQRQQRPKQGAQGLGIQSAISSMNKLNAHGTYPVNNKQPPAKTKGNTPNTTQTPKTRTPPSLEHTKPPPKKLNLEERAMEIDTGTQCAGILRDNEVGKDNLNVTRQDTNECASTAIRSNIESDENTTRCNLAKQDVNEGKNTTRSNAESDEIITRRNFTVVEICTSSNEFSNDETTINKNNAKVENPYEVEMDGDDDETLEDLSPEFAKMGRILAREITKSLSKALIPLQREINELKESQNSNHHKNDMQEILEGNDRLKTKVDQLKTFNVKLKNKLNHIEDKLLENNLLFFGVSEKEGETKYERYNVILDIISTTFVGPNYETQVQQTRQIQVEKLVRRGRYSQNKTRPISVTFAHQRDLQELLANRKYLPFGVAISKEFGEHTENEQRFLKPILRAANTKTGYRKKCRLEGDHLVIKGKHYTRDNIDELPEDLSGYKITSKEDSETVGFFGELNPLSNFHRSHFIVNNQWFHCTEQYIQHKKAKFFNDKPTALKIMASDSAMECKLLARNIKNYDVTRWNEAAESECFDGILEKFAQNPVLNKVLQDTGHKTLAESCYDRIWGTGVPLHSPDALNTD